MQEVMNKLRKTIAGSPDKPLKIKGIEIDCYVLDDETRVISQRGMFKAIGIARGGPNGGKEGVGAEMPRFAVNNWIKPFINNELRSELKFPIQFLFEGKITYGYPATALVRLCWAIDRADRAGRTTSRQADIVRHVSLIIEAISQVGITALIDEATGYQYKRGSRALAEFLERYLASELQPWVKTFPTEFYQQIYRLKGKRWPKNGKFPKWLGHVTNDIVYSRLAPGVLEELRELNPVLPSGNRQNRHHQWLNVETGHPKLDRHIEAVILIMSISPTWEWFILHLDKRFPRIGGQLTFPFDSFSYR